LRLGGYNVVTSFQAHIDNIQQKLAKTPDDFLKAANAKGVDGSNAPVMQVVDWLKSH
jgi:hypothetical protein